jgi:GNAT superfamily N-acetyltransferase
MTEINIVDYQPAFAADYKRLNVEWIQQYFQIEEHDLEQLNNPEEYIISRNGYILFAVEGERVVGTCALIKTGPDEFEMAKMAVVPDMQGKQIGKKLGLAAIKKAADAGAQRIWLESNHILKPALNLYIQLGFVQIPVGDTPYARADVKMEMFLPK